MQTNQYSVSYLGYQPALDGLRAVAVLLVMCTHANFQLGENGAIGVDIFFVLSGFLITTLLLEENEKNGTISFIGFYLRRATRLFPGLYVMLFILSIYALFIDTLDLSIILKEEIISSALYIRNISWSWGYALDDKLLGHTWSLAVEEQFYLIWPIILFLGIKYLRALMLALFLFILLSFCIKGIFYQSYIYSSIIHESIFIGCLTALFRWRNLIKFEISTFSTLIFLLILTLIGLSNTTFYKQLYGSGFRGIFGIVAGFLILGVTSKSNYFLDLILKNKLSVFIGKISYGLYLWHVPVFRLFKMHSPFQPAISFVLKFIVTFFIAWLSWVLIEKRLVQFGRRYTKKVS